MDLEVFSAWTCVPTIVPGNPWDAVTSWPAGDQKTIGDRNRAETLVILIPLSQFSIELAKAQTGE